MSEELYKLVVKMSSDVGEIKGKLDQALETQEKHAEQINGLEKVKTQALTLIGVVSFGFTFGWEWVKSKIGIS